MQVVGGGRKLHNNYYKFFHCKKLESGKSQAFKGIIAIYIFIIMKLEIYILTSLNKN